MANKSVLIIIVVLVCIVSMIIAGASYYEGWTCTLGFGNACPSSGSTSTSPTTPSGDSGSGDSGGGDGGGDGGDSGSGDSGGGDGGDSGSGDSGGDSGSSDSGSGDSGSSGSGSLIITTPNQACVGHWGDCSVTCGGGTKSWIIDRKQGSSGAVCKDENGTPMTDSSGNLTSAATNAPCNTQGCTQNCIGSWSGWTTCPATCGGSQSNTFTVTQNPLNGGTPCDTIYGQDVGNASVGHDRVITRPCPNVCPGPQNASGYWSEWGPCYYLDDPTTQVSCTVPAAYGVSTAYQRRHFILTTFATNGGSGATDNGILVTDSNNVLTAAGTQQRVCTGLTNCCTDALTSQIVGPWTYENGGPLCANDPPSQLWSRSINFGAKRDFTGACGFVTTKTTYSADNTGVVGINTTNKKSGSPTINRCPRQRPTSGQCPNGKTWTATDNPCALPDVIADYTCPAMRLGADNDYNASVAYGEVDKTIPGCMQTYTMSNRYGRSNYRTTNNKLLNTSSVTCPRYYIRKSTTIPSTGISYTTNLRDFLTCVQNPSLTRPKNLVCPTNGYFIPDSGGANWCNPTNKGAGAPPRTANGM